jgi:hypothetical protein
MTLGEPPCAARPYIFCFAYRCVWISGRNGLTKDLCGAIMYEQNIYAKEVVSDGKRRKKDGAL